MSQILDAINKAEEERKRHTGQDTPEITDRTAVYEHITPKAPVSKKSKTLPLLLLFCLAISGAGYIAYQNGYFSSTEESDKTAPDPLAVETEETKKTAETNTVKNDKLDSQELVAREEVASSDNTSDNTSDSTSEKTISNTSVAQEKTAVISKDREKQPINPANEVTDNSPTIKTIPHPSSKPVDPKVAASQVAKEVAKEQTNEEIPTEEITQQTSNTTGNHVEVIDITNDNNEEMGITDDEEFAVNDVSTSELKPLRPILESETKPIELKPITAAKKTPQPKAKKVRKPKVITKANKSKKTRPTTQSTRSSSSAWKKKLSITAIVYDVNPKSRMVLMNGRIIREGMRIPNSSSKLISILAKGIIVDDGNGEVFISLH